MMMCTFKQPMRLLSRVVVLLAAFTLFVNAPTASAESALDLLSGFDQVRIDACYPAGDEETKGELAKLLYRLRKANANVLSERAKSGAEEPELGDAVKFDGLVTKVGLSKVPAKLIEFLEFKSFAEVTIDGTTKIVSPPVSGELTVGDRVSGIGVVIENSDAPAIATGRLKWFPKQPPSASWRMLSENGVDVSSLADIGSRNRKSLLPADADAFYPMLAAAEHIGSQPEVPTAKKAEPVALLKTPKKFAGQWLSMSLETIRVTRVNVSDPERQQQLGGEHYYQVDAKGDLGNTIIELQRAPDEPGEPIRFSNKYPVSIVVKSLPDFLAKEIAETEGEESVVALVSKPVRIEGFFFRLWSYSSDFMERQGGGDQFGPLIIAARMTHTPPTPGDPMGIRVIGYVAAGAVILGIIGTFFWSRSNSREDDQERRKRRDREAQDLKLPSDL